MSHTEAGSHCVQIAGCLLELRDPLTIALLQPPLLTACFLLLHSACVALDQQQLQLLALQALQITGCQSSSCLMAAMAWQHYNRNCECTVTVADLSGTKLTPAAMHHPSACQHQTLQVQGHRCNRCTHCAGTAGARSSAPLAATTCARCPSLPWPARPPRRCHRHLHRLSISVSATRWCCCVASL
jgi:hypothetical protein